VGVNSKYSEDVLLKIFYKNNVNNKFDEINYVWVKKAANLVWIGYPYRHSKNEILSIIKVNIWYRNTFPHDEQVPRSAKPLKLVRPLQLWNCSQSLPAQIITFA